MTLACSRSVTGALFLCPGDTDPPSPSAARNRSVCYNLSHADPASH